MICWKYCKENLRAQLLVAAIIEKGHGYLAGFEILKRLFQNLCDSSERILRRYEEISRYSRLRRIKSNCTMRGPVPAFSEGHQHLAP